VSAKSADRGLVSFLPKLKKAGRGGHVVNVSSMAAYLSGPQAGIYTASKFAVRGLTESLRYNLVPYGIGVSLVCPALVATDAGLSEYIVAAELRFPLPPPAGGQ